MLGQLSPRGLRARTELARAANITSTNEVYLRRGACGHHLGRLETDANLEVATTKTNVLFDL